MPTVAADGTAGRSRPSHTPSLTPSVVHLDEFEGLALRVLDQVGEPCLENSVCYVCIPSL